MYVISTRPPTFAPFCVASTLSSAGASRPPCCSAGRSPLCCLRLGRVCSLGWAALLRVQLILLRPSDVVSWQWGTGAESLSVRGSHFSLVLLEWAHGRFKFKGREYSLPLGGRGLVTFMLDSPAASTMVGPWPCGGGGQQTRS